MLQIATLLVTLLVYSLKYLSSFVISKYLFYAYASDVCIYFFYLNLTICNFTMNCVNVPVPETPINVRATGVTNTSIALMWDEVKGIDCEFVTVVGSCMYILPLLY